jgi:PAS domain S-box-containing protein
MDHSIGSTETLKEGAGRLLFDAAAEGLLIVDAEGNILVTNQRIDSMFGYAPGELVGQKVEVLIPKALHGRHHGHREAYRQEPRKRSMGSGMDLSAVKKSGMEFPVEVSLNHMYEDGQMRVMALITDITDRKLAQHRLQMMNQSLEQMVEERTRALQESQHLYRTIARHFPNGTINVFDRDLKYVFVEGQELFRYRLTSENLMGTSYLDRLPEDVRAEIEPHLRRVFDGEDLSFEVNTRGESYLLNAVGLPDSSGELHQILVVEQNMTTQKKAQERVSEALEKERELNELKSRFVSMASHEFRTPLSTILTSVSLLKKYNEPENADKRMKHLQRIHSSVQNLTNILNDFLSLDKLEEGRIQAKPDNLEIDKLLGDLVEEMETHCKTGQRIELTTDNACGVYSDEHILRNVVLNLLSNAIKYSPEHSSIDVRCKKSDRGVTVSVTDRGIGIPLEEQEHLFSRFFRASNAINIQGTGLGLHIVKRYTDLLKGELSFESIPGTGTTFTFTVPYTLA